MKFSDEQRRVFKRADRLETVGKTLTYLAAAAWVWFLYLLLMPYEVDSPAGGATIDCRSPFGLALSDRPPHEACEVARDAPELLVVLGLATLVSLGALASRLAGAIPTQAYSVASELDRQRQRNQQDQNSG